MAYFQTKIHTLVNFVRYLQWKMLVYFTSIWYNLWPFGLFYGHLVYFVAIWYILWLFGVFLEKIWQPWSRAEDWELKRTPTVFTFVYNSFWLLEALFQLSEQKKAETEEFFQTLFPLRRFEFRKKLQPREILYWFCAICRLAESGMSCLKKMK
jgi:hypothetical protein